MPAFRSYADLMASKPPPPSSSRPAVRKPLTHTSPPRTQSLTSERHGSTALHMSSPSSLSVIADSPRRLLSYYLSKAAYNTDESDAGHSPQADRYEDRPGAMAQDENSFAEAHAVQPSASSSSRPLRPPPFAQSATFSKGLNATPAPTPAPPVPSPRLRQQPPSPFVRSSRPAEKRVNFSLASEAAGDTSMEDPRTAASPAAGRETAWAAVSAVNNAGKQATDASLPPPHTHASQRMPSPLINTPSLVRYTAYTEEEQRQYEAEIMNQVDALLQAQRSEWRAEVEAHCLAAQEAQATLSVVENALSEQLGGTAVAASGFAAGLTFSSSAARVPSPTPPSDEDVDRLAMDMMRVAVAATPAATQRLLDAIMSIQDGQDVPSELLQVVRSLYEELTRALVPPVMNFVQTRCGYEQHQHQLPPQMHRSGDASVLQRTTDQSEALVEAQATILALQEEVMIVRRALDARLSSGCVLPSTAKSTDSTASVSTEAVRQALLDRFFSECHGALTRSRQESLTLRRALEEERRRHFLTRIRLLGPTAASDGLPAAPQQRQEMAASPTQRSSTASRERPLDAPRVSAASPATLLKALERGRSSVHRWTPASSPMALASQSAGNEEDEEDEDGMTNVEDSIGTASGRERASSVDSQARRAPTSTDRPLRTPALQTAQRVADEVLRSTAGHSGAVDTPTAHPYYAQRRPAAARHDALVAERHVPEKSRQLQGEVSGPSVTFAEASTESFQGAASGSRGHRVNDLPSSGAIARAAGTAADALGPQPDSEYEKRVWNTAVELLSRYSVA